jgi:hypothetical protein
MGMRTIALVAVMALAITAVTGSSASATTLEVGGSTQNKAVTIEASATAGTMFAKTDGTEAGTCSVSSLHGITSVFSGTKVTGGLSEISFKTCKREPVVVDAAGSLYFEHETGTTSGEIYWEGAEVTVPTPFGFSVTCSTGSGTRIGTLDAASSTSSHATITFSAVMNCGVFLPSAIWIGAYKVSSPTGLGVVS